MNNFVFSSEPDRGSFEVNWVDQVLKAVKQPKLALRYLVDNLLKGLTTLNNAALGRQRKCSCPPSGLRSFDEIAQRALARTDMSDHLTTLFVESLPVRPSVIVELGVRGGESTFVLERVAQLYGSKLVSVDIEDCSRVSSYPNWSFVKSDDIAFAQGFPEWCREQQIRPLIDILFIDTSHEFEHTLKEVTHWFPFLSNRAKVFIHDTNMKKVFFRKDGSMGFAWDNDRGVIAALENYFGRQFDETHDFTAFTEGWIMKHHANCCGMTILEILQWDAFSDRQMPPSMLSRRGKSSF